MTYGEGFRLKRLTIAGRDISEYSIYLFPDADECHTFAAQELRKYIGLACGYYPNIVNEKRGHMIVLERLSTIRRSARRVHAFREGRRKSVHHGRKMARLHVTACMSFSSATSAGGSSSIGRPKKIYRGE